MRYGLACSERRSTPSSRSCSRSTARRDLMSGMTRRTSFRAVETDSGIDSAIVHITREVATRVQAATYDELLPFRVKSGVLQVRVVLVRPEPVDLVVRDVLAEHVACSSGALLDGVLPMFHSDPAIEDRVIVIRDVTCGVHAADVRLAVPRRRPRRCPRESRCLRGVPLPARSRCPRRRSRIQDAVLLS